MNIQSQPNCKVFRCHSYNPAVSCGFKPRCNTIIITEGSSISNKIRRSRTCTAQCRARNKNLPIKASATPTTTTTTTTTTTAGYVTPNSSSLKWAAPFFLPSAAALATAAYAGTLTPEQPQGAAWLMRLMLLAAGPLLLHVILPCVDLLALNWRGQQQLQQQHTGPLLPPAPKAPPADDFTARLMPTLAIVVHLAVAATAYTAIAMTAPLQPLLLPLLSYSLATSATGAMAASHELVHSRNAVHLAVAALFLTLYWWYPYYRAHHQHHLHVCTPVDYTCAQKGLNAYSYFLSYFPSSYAEAWELAARECNRAGKPKFSTHNSTLVAVLAQALLTAGIYAVFGPLVTAVHLGSNFIMLIYMAVFDYVLHYGLVRPPMPGKECRSTPITPYNSWNSLYPLENGIFFNVLYHSDHHMYGMKSYGSLAVPAADSPTFPLPINLMAISVFVPPLWMAMMDSRADEANRRHLEYLQQQQQQQQQ